METNCEDGLWEASKMLKNVESKYIPYMIFQWWSALPYMSLSIVWVSDEHLRVLIQMVQDAHARLYEWRLYKSDYFAQKWIQRVKQRIDFMLSIYGSQQQVTNAIAEDPQSHYRSEWYSTDISIYGNFRVHGIKRM